MESTTCLLAGSEGFSHPAFTQQGQDEWGGEGGGLTNRLQRVDRAVIFAHSYPSLYGGAECSLVSADYN